MQPHIELVLGLKTIAGRLITAKEETLASGRTKGNSFETTRVQEDKVEQG